MSEWSTLSCVIKVEDKSKILDIIKSTPNEKVNTFVKEAIMEAIEKGKEGKFTVTFRTDTKNYFYKAKVKLEQETGKKFEKVADVILYLIKEFTQR